MELARIDASIATFWGVHTGLSAGSIYLCGDEEQKQRWLPLRARETLPTREMEQEVVAGSKRTKFAAGLAQVGALRYDEKIAQVRAKNGERRRRRPARRKEGGRP